MDYETLHLIGIVLLCVAIACLVIAIIIFFKFRVVSVIGNLTGQNAKKAIKKMKEDKGQTSVNISNFDDMKKADILKTEEIISNSKESTSDETVLLNNNNTTALDNNKTAVLVNNETEKLDEFDYKLNKSSVNCISSKENMFDIEVDEIIVHTTEIIK